MYTFLSYHIMVHFSLICSGGSYMMNCAHKSLLVQPSIQTDGQSQRNIQVLEDMLRDFVINFRGNWDKFLP